MSSARTAILLRTLLHRRSTLQLRLAFSHPLRPLHRWQSTAAVPAAQQLKDINWGRPAKQLEQTADEEAENSDLRPAVWAPARLRPSSKAKVDPLDPTVPMSKLSKAGLTARIVQLNTNEKCLRAKELQDLCEQPGFSSSDKRLARPTLEELHAELSAREVEEDTFLLWCRALSTNTYALLVSKMGTAPWPIFLLRRLVTFTSDPTTEAAQTLDIVTQQLPLLNPLGAIPLLRDVITCLTGTLDCFDLADSLTSLVLATAQRIVREGDSEATARARALLVKLSKHLNRINTPEYQFCLARINRFTAHHAEFSNLSLRRKARRTKWIQEALESLPEPDLADRWKLEKNRKIERYGQAANLSHVHSAHLAFQLVRAAHHRLASAHPADQKRGPWRTAVAGEVMETLAQRRNWSAVLEFAGSLPEIEVQVDDRIAALAASAMIRTGSAEASLVVLEEFLSARLAGQVDSATTASEKPLASDAVTTVEILRRSLVALKDTGQHHLFFTWVDRAVVDFQINPDGATVDVILNTARHVSLDDRLDENFEPLQFFDPVWWDTTGGAMTASMATTGRRVDGEGCIAALRARSLFRCLLAGIHPELMQAPNPLETVRDSAGWVMRGELSMRKFEQWVFAHLVPRSSSLSSSPFGSLPTGARERAREWHQRWFQIGHEGHVLLDPHLLDSYVALLHFLRLLQLNGVIPDEASDDGQGIEAGSAGASIGEEILQTLSWHEMLGIKPSHQTLCIACMEIARSVPPASSTRWGGGDGSDSPAGPLHAWLADWLGEEAIPTDEQVARVWKQTTLPLRKRRRG